MTSAHTCIHRVVSRLDLANVGLAGTAAGGDLSSHPLEAHLHVVVTHTRTEWEGKRDGNVSVGLQPNIFKYVERGRERRIDVDRRRTRDGVTAVQRSHRMPEASVRRRTLLFFPMVANERKVGLVWVLLEAFHHRLWVRGVHRSVRASTLNMTSTRPSTS